MNFLIRLRSLGLKNRMNTLDDGHILGNRDEIQCGSVRISRGEQVGELQRVLY